MSSGPTVSMLRVVAPVGRLLCQPRQCVCVVPFKSPTSFKAHVDPIRVPVVAFVLVRGQQARCESLFGHSADMVQKEGSDQWF